MSRRSKKSKDSSDNLKQTQLSDYFSSGKKDEPNFTPKIKPKTMKAKKKVKTSLEVIIILSDSDEERENIDNRPVKTQATPAKTPQIKTNIQITKSTPLMRTSEKVPRVLQQKSAPTFLQRLNVHEQSSCNASQKYSPSSTPTTSKRNVSPDKSLLRLQNVLPEDEFEETSDEEVLLSSSVPSPMKASSSKSSQLRNKVREAADTDVSPPKQIRLSATIPSPKKEAPDEPILSTKRKLFKDETINSKEGPDLNLSFASDETVIADLSEYGIHFYDNDIKTEENLDIFDEDTRELIESEIAATQSEVLLDKSLSIENDAMQSTQCEVPDAVSDVKNTIMLKVKSDSQLFEKKNIVDDVPNALETMILPKTCTIESNEQFISMKQFERIYEYILESPNLYSLLYDAEKESLIAFFKISAILRFVCFKLFVRIPKWRNIKHFLNTSLKLEYNDDRIEWIYQELQETCFVVTDYSQESAIDLLNLLSVDKVKEIFQSFKLKPKKRMNKSDYVEAILKNCNSQTTLFRRSDAILLDRIKNKMDKCLKLDDSFLKTLRRIHLLYYFPKPDMFKPADLYMYMYKIQANEIILPNYTTEYAQIFKNQDEFYRYSFSMEYFIEYNLYKEKNDKEMLLKTAKGAFTELQKTIEAKYTDNIDRPNFLKRFSAGYVYVKTVTQACEEFTKSWEVVKDWLTFLLKQDQYCLSKRGAWFYKLASIAENYEKDYNLAAQILCEAILDPMVSLIDQHLISERASRLLLRKNNVISEEVFELLREVLLISPDSGLFPYTITEAHTTKSANTPGSKKVYVSHTPHGTTYSSVENIALNYYATENYPEGMHCEGSLISSIFFLLFWDIIYEATVPSTFVSEIQNTPLDLKSKDFYNNRKEKIDERLSNIITYWTDEFYKAFFYDNLNIYGDKYSLISNNIASERVTIYNAVNCIPREVLGKILKRLALNFAAHQSGMPDLYVWNQNTFEYKFVEVKGEGDKLSMKQKLWLEYLISVGANAEVCYVNTIGSRVKKR